MAAIDVLSAHDWVELLIGAVSVLGGSMAFFSGFEAWQAEIEGAAVTEVAARVNHGLAHGFYVGVRAALFAGAILALS